MRADKDLQTSKDTASADMANNEEVIEEVDAAREETQQTTTTQVDAGQAEPQQTITTQVDAAHEEPPQRETPQVDTTHEEPPQRETTPVEPTSDIQSDLPSDLQSDIQEDYLPVEPDEAHTPHEQSLSTQDVVFTMLPVISDDHGQVSVHKKVQQNRGQNPVDSLKEGMRAIGEVRAAAKEHADAKAELKNLTDELKKSTALLEHRQKITQDFDNIVISQRAIIAEQDRVITDANATITVKKSQMDEFNHRLTQMRADHAEELKPYKDSMDSTKARADEAARKFAEMKRTIKSAEAQVTEMTKRRETRVAAANKAVDAATDRLRRAEADLRAQQASPTATPAALRHLQSEIAAERAHLDGAREEVARVTSDCQRAVDIAQTHMWTQKQSLEVVERQANEAKAEADSHREEYERLYNTAQNQEKALEQDIQDAQKETASAQNAISTANAKKQNAQALIDEAYDITQHPEVTQALKDSITAAQAALDAQKSEVEDLAKREKHLREITRTKRYVVIAVSALVALLLVILLVRLLKS